MVGWAAMVLDEVRIKKKHDGWMEVLEAAILSVIVRLRHKFAIPQIVTMIVV